MQTGVSNPEQTSTPMDPEQFAANLDRFLIAGVKNEATTIYLFPGTTITYRVGAKLMRGSQPVLTPALTRAAAAVMLPVVLLPENTPEARRTYLDKVQSSNFSYSIQGISRFRVHLFRQRGSLALCVRIIPQEIPDLTRFGLSEDFFAHLKEPKGGLFVIQGKARSGKSSVAAAVVDYINRTASRMILVLEPTIQFSHKNNYSMITQREVGTDTPTMSVGIEDAQREDQDLLVVDEIADAEAFEKAMESVSKGIMVFLVVPTPEIEKTVTYFLNLKPSSRQMELLNDLMTSWKGLLSTTLVPAPDGRRVLEVRYVPGNILNGVLLSKRTDMEQRSSQMSDLKDIESASSVDQSWFDND